jgi:hypothetical protein
MSCVSLTLVKFLYPTYAIVDLNHLSRKSLLRYNTHAQNLEYFRADWLSISVIGGSLLD